MSKPSQGSSKASSSSKPPPFKQKTIQHTQDLLKANVKAKSNGKGKERAILGEVADLLGQTKKIPSSIQVERFAEVRALEILALQNAMKSAAALGSTRTFQSLPRHLRRRAASHNPRRVPKRYRARAAAEIPEVDKVAKLHRKRAKLRRKGNLRGESRTEQLQRRQRDKTWLSTHIWHAKRFHMTNLWSHRLPLTPTLKSFRPSYRAARHRAIVQDVSYYGTIELEGKREDILRLLGGTVAGRFAGSKYESGGRVADADMFKYGCMPDDLFGPVQILWKPQSEEEGDRTIWLRIHPSIFADVYANIASTLLLPEFQQHASSSSVPNPVLQLRDLRTEINSFEITGPRAGRVLRRILRLCKTEGKDKKDFFASLQELDPAEIPQDMVVGLRVQDPRLIFPASMLKETSSIQNDNGVQKSLLQLEPSSALATSDLWDSDLRMEMATPRFKKSDLDNRRRKAGIPAMPLRSTPQDDRIPLILIKRSIQSSVSPSSSFHGFTILLPKGYSNYFLTSFVYAGCAVGGLAERRVQYREAGVASFPEHYGAVCRDGTEWEESKASEEESRWTRRPPGKRVEWDAVNTRSPWKPDWQVIMGVCDLEERTMNGKGTSKLEPWLLSEPFLSYLPKLATATNPPNTLLALINAFRKQRSLPELDTPASDVFNTAILHVQVSVEGRGSPGDMAALYALDQEETHKWMEAKEADEKWGRAGWEGSMRDEKKSEIQKLGEMVPDSTRIIGYTSSGNFSLSRGNGFALGQITLKAYLHAFIDQSAASSGPGGSAGIWVKVKNRDGAICRLARVNLSM